MAKYRITAPNGAIHELTAPDSASQQDIASVVQQQLGRLSGSDASAARAPRYSSQSVPIKDGKGGVKWVTRAELGIPADLSGVPRVDDTFNTDPARGPASGFIRVAQAPPQIGPGRAPFPTVPRPQPGPIVPRPQPADDPKFGVTPVPGSTLKRFIPRYSFYFVDGRTNRTVGNHIKDGEAFNDFGDNANAIPDSLEQGNVGGHNPNNNYILIERLV